jgi:hypothetical protein
VDVPNHLLDVADWTYVTAAWACFACIPKHRSPRAMRIKRYFFIYANVKSFGMWGRFRRIGEI